MGNNRRSQVIEVKPSDVSLKPMLIEFEHGTLRKKEIAKIQCDFLRSKRDPKEIVLLLKSKEEVYQYKGHKIDEDSQLCQRFFVIRNKRTNKIRLASVEQLFVSRYLGNVARSDEISSLSITNNGDDRAENLRNLSRAFGSKRSQRGLEVQSRTKINSEVVKAQMEETISSISKNKKGIDEVDRNDKPENGSILLPKCNRDARVVRDVYKLEDLFTSSDIFDSLSDVAQSVMDHCPTEPDKEYSTFLVSALKIVPSITIDKIKCLIYIDALLRFINIDARRLSNKLIAYDICPLSKQIRTIVFNNFTVFSKSGRTRPLFMRDKAISYLLVLLMIVFEYKLDQDYVSGLFGKKIAFSRLTLISRAIGFTSSLKKYWVLKVPLPPVQTTARRVNRKLK